MNLTNSSLCLDKQQTATRFHQRILTWYRLHGRRGLPWQVNKTDYRVWISEVMLQQTQVKTVIPYYTRFIASFPDVHALAKSPIDKVLALWTGLGYYSRARNIHRAAQIISKQYDGELPRASAELMALPGIGKSTANAISSIVHQRATAILDGNVKRVLCRYFGVFGNTEQSSVKNTLWQLAQQLMPTTNCGDYTQAIMDLGANCCKRLRPSCEQCPLNQDCYAYENELTAALPEKKKRKALPLRHSHFLVIENAHHEILLERREEQGVWGGLWVLPQTKAQDLPIFKQFRHTFSHFHLEMSFSKSPEEPHKLGANQAWFNKQKLKTVGLPKPIAQTLEEILC